MREHYPLPTIESITHKLSKAKVFSVLDAKTGYWQLKLDDESSKLTTFNSPFGRWCFVRMPFGIVSAQEIFQRKAHETLEGLVGVEVLIDDILVYGATKQEHDKNLRALLQRCKDKNLKLNAEKMQISVDKVNYFGHVLSAKGVEIDPRKSKKELETFLGTVNYLSKFSPNLAEVVSPLRKLVHKSTQFVWDTNMEEAFKKTKDLISKSPVLSYFDVNKDVTLQVDGSQNAVGSVLMQEGKPVAYSSRLLKDTQSKWAQIEKELFAIYAGCEKFQKYMFGRTVNVQTDHNKPIENIVNKPLYKCPPRLQRMFLSLQKYDLDIKYCRGKDIPVADMLSRNRHRQQCSVEDEKIEEIVHVVLDHIPVSDNLLAEIKNEYANDSQMCNLMDIIRTGWPNSKNQVSEDLKPYWSEKEELSIVDGLLLKGQRIVIPNKMRSETLAKIHEGHFGIVLCKRRARDLVYWPNINSQIEEMVAKCEVCQEHHRKNQKETLIPTETPVRPWQILGSDLFCWNGKDFVIVVDYYSRYFEVAQLNSTTASTVIDKIKAILARHGQCEKLITDCGPQYMSQEFVTFSKEWNFSHCTSSPYHHQANGLAEKYVGIVKNILKKSKQNKQDIYQGLLAYRTTPIDDLASPGELLMNRRLKSNLPTNPELLKPKVINPERYKRS